MENLTMKDKVVVITGAGGVLCSAMAKAFAEKGAKVCLLDRNPDAVQLVAKSITDQGYIAKGFTCNVLEKDSLIACREEIRKAFGPCDILINGAGGNNAKGQTSHDYFDPKDIDDPDVQSFFDLELSGFDFVFKLNIIGTFLVTQVFAEDMVKKRKGNIINISSMNSYRPLTRIPAYSSAKAGVSNFTQWLAVHFAGTGIRVNAIAPGFFSTKQNKTLLFNEDGSLTERSQKIISHTPMGRFGVPEDLLGTMLYLADDNVSGFVTGIIIPVDGGFSAFSGV